MGSAQIGNQVRLGSPRRYITRGPGNLAASPQRPSRAYITDSPKKQDRHSESGAVSNGDGDTPTCQDSLADTVTENQFYGWKFWNGLSNLVIG